MLHKFLPKTASKRRKQELGWKIARFRQPWRDAGQVEEDGMRRWNKRAKNYLFFTKLERLELVSWDLFGLCICP